MTLLTTKVERLLASDLTTYRIGKDAKVNDVSIDRYRKGKASIANMPLGVAEKLGAYSDKYFKELADAEKPIEKISKKFIKRVDLVTTKQNQIFK